MSTAIKFENISKQYRLGLVSTQTLSHDLNRWWTTNIRGKEEDPQPLNRSKSSRQNIDLDFVVQQGDVLGIIGKNGAGKSFSIKFNTLFML